MDRISRKGSLLLLLVSAAAGATDLTSNGLTCNICDSPTFVACSSSTASSPRCQGMKGNELRVFCGGKLFLTVACATPKLRYGVDGHGIPDKGQNLLSCSP